MKLVVLSVIVILFVWIIVRIIKYHNAIHNGRCPICGAPIIPFANEHCEGYRCTECDWWEATDITHL